MPCPPGLAVHAALARQVSWSGCCRVGAAEPGAWAGPPVCVVCVQVVQNEPVRFPEDVLVTDALKHLLNAMMAKVRSAGG